LSEIEFVAGQDETGGGEKRISRREGRGDYRAQGMEGEREGREGQWEEREGKENLLE
jgi:hypothetical protein